MERIFVDECGFTGPNLTDPAQPVFVLASLRLDEEQAQEVKAQFFGDVQADELKFSSVSRRDRGRTMVLEFLRYLDRNQNIQKTSQLHKQFALVCKIVDLLIEPAAYRDGINLYDKGANLALSNALFFLARSSEAGTFFDEFISLFQSMVRQPSRHSYDAFFELVYSQTEPDPLDNMLVFVRACDIRIGYAILEDLSEDCLDLCTTSALALMASWRSEISDPISLVHDRSSSMARNRFVWEAMVDPNLTPVSVGYDRRKHEYPIAVHETLLEDSKNWAGLQLVDMLAGSVAGCASWAMQHEKKEDGFAEDILGIIGNWDVECWNWPEAKFTPEELEATEPNAEDPLEHFEQVMRNRYKESRRTHMPQDPNRYQEIRDLLDEAHREKRSQSRKRKWENAQIFLDSLSPEQLVDTECQLKGMTDDERREWLDEHGT